MGKYVEQYQQSLSNPDGFWAKAAEAVDWDQPATKVLDDSKAPMYRWFSGAKLNTCYNALDRHVKNGRAEQAALIYDSPVTDAKRTYSYQELLDEVSKLAGVLADLGVEKGDRVLIYMPMIPQGVMAMLACARIGAVHSVVFGGFAAAELATRINDAKPKVVLSTSCGIEGSRIIKYKPLLDGAIELSTHKPANTVIFQRPQAVADMQEGRDVDWASAVASATPANCVSVEATDPLYILYTSGTTGQPKGVVRDNGGHAVALMWTMKNLYNIQPGEVFWAASDIGWVVGHSYICYGPLLNGSTTLIFEGKPIGTPDPGAFWRIISEHKVASLFTAPTALRAIRKEDPDCDYIKKYDMSCMRALFLAGERCDPDTLFWAQDKIQVPVVDHWWQTETGWAIAANCLGLEEFPVKPGSPTKPVPGYDVQFLDEAGQQVAAGEMGAIAIKLPLPPGTFPTLWQNDERFFSSYLETFEGYYETGDAGYQDEEGYVYIMGRTDDVINVAGHRLSTGAMEEVIAAHPDVAECAVIGVADKLKGQSAMGFAVLQSGANRDDAEVVKELIALIREKIGPVAAFRMATIVKRLPKTRSGKILRGTMRSMADGVEHKVPATIDDPETLDEIAENLKALGYPKSV
ncbi:MAG: propionyl-CoA synthetase [Cycloclasticus sp. symbiont of Poecilosclerida sp. M]|nr:MAG: propionyl-CoA synthetase [Cycloclasticus sp. symbiont of Poecilosclerida sp. M]